MLAQEANLRMRIFFLALDSLGCMPAIPVRINSLPAVPVRRNSLPAGPVRRNLHTGGSGAQKFLPAGPDVLVSSFFWRSRFYFGPT